LPSAARSIGHAVGRAQLIPPTEPHSKGGAVTAVPCLFRRSTHRGGASKRAQPRGRPRASRRWCVPRWHLIGVRISPAQVCWPSSEVRRLSGRSAQRVTADRLASRGDGGTGGAASTEEHTVTEWWYVLGMLRSPGRPYCSPQTVHPFLLHTPLRGPSRRRSVSRQEFPVAARGALWLGRATALPWLSAPLNVTRSGADFRGAMRPRPYLGANLPTRWSIRMHLAARPHHRCPRVAPPPLSRPSHVRGGQVSARCVSGSRRSAASRPRTFCSTGRSSSERADVFIWSWAQKTAKSDTRRICSRVEYCSEVWVCELQTRVWWDSGVHQDRMPVLSGISCGARTHRRNVPHSLTRHYRQRLVRNTMRETRDQTRGLRLLSDVRLAIEAGEMLAKATTANSVTASRLASIQAGGVAAFQSISHRIYRTPHSEICRTRPCHTRISVRLISNIQLNINTVSPVQTSHRATLACPAGHGSHCRGGGARGFRPAATAGPVGPDQLQPPRWVLRRGLPQ